MDGVPLGGAGNVSGIRVPDRNDKARNSVVFKRAINVNGLALTEYMDWYVDGKSLGKMLFWGFTISGRPAEVMERLRPLIKDEERLRKDGAGFMRAEVKIAQSPWVPAIVNSGRCRRFEQGRADADDRPGRKQERGHGDVLIAGAA